MSRTFPWRWGAAPFRRDWSNGAASGKGSAHLTGMPKCPQPYATTPAAAREQPDILCRFPETPMRIRTALVTLLAIALFAWFISRANLAAIATEIQHARIDLIVWA